MKRKVKNATKTEEPLTPAEKKWGEVFERQDRAFRRFVTKFLKDLLVAVIIGILMTIAIYVFCQVIEIIL